MRTTVNLDQDVAARVERLRTGRKGNLRDLLNMVLRAGLDALEANGARRSGRRYRISPHDSGKPFLPDVDDVASAVEAAEGPAWK